MGEAAPPPKTGIEGGALEPPPTPCPSDHSLVFLSIKAGAAVATSARK
jgi:hypothetical protein